MTDKPNKFITFFRNFTKWDLILYLGIILVLGQPALKDFRDYQLRDWVKGEATVLFSGTVTNEGYSAPTPHTSYHSKLVFTTTDGKEYEFVHNAQLKIGDTVAILYPAEHPADAIVEDSKYPYFWFIELVGYILLTFGLRHLWQTRHKR